MQMFENHVNAWEFNQSENVYDIYAQLFLKVPMSI